MKKIISAFIAASLFSGFAFAKTYKGDIQLNFGGSGDIINVNEDSHDSKIQSGMFEFDIQTWHLFGINDVFSVGFMAGINSGIGATTKWQVEDQDLEAVLPDQELALALHYNFLVGPAVGFDLGKVVRFNLAAGFDWGLSFVSTKYKDDESELNVSYFVPAGIGTEVQAKFLPKARVSPVVTYRLTADFTDSAYTYDSKEKEHDDHKMDSISILNNAFTVGISFNW